MSIVLPHASKYNPLWCHDAGPERDCLGPWCLPYITASAQQNHPSIWGRFLARGCNRAGSVEASGIDTKYPRPPPFSPTVSSQEHNIHLDLSETTIAVIGKMILLTSPSPKHLPKRQQRWTTLNVRTRWRVSRHSIVKNENTRAAAQPFLWVQANSTLRFIDFSIESSLHQ